MSSIELCEKDKKRLIIKSLNDHSTIVVQNEKDIKTIIDDLKDVCTIHKTKEGETFRILESQSKLVNQLGEEGNKYFKIQSYRKLSKGITMIFLKQKRDVEGLRFHFDYNVVKDFLSSVPITPHLLII